MSPKSLKHLKSLRILSQVLFFSLFLFFYIRSLDPFSAVENPFLRYDPLVFLTNPDIRLPVVAAVTAVLLAAAVAGRVFCGWVCPLGGLIEALDFLLKPLRKRNPLALKRFSQRMSLVRYPISLFFLGVVIVTAFTSAPVLQFLHPNIWILRIVSLTPIGLAFLGLCAVFSLFARRLWCTYLCPLGALYGLLARLPLLRLRITSCTNCARCDRCPTDAADYRKREIASHQCILCFDYEAGCPAEGFVFSLPRSDNRARARTLAASRRNFLVAGLHLLIGATLGGMLSALVRRRITPLLRPPGVVDETHFLESCLRCLQCVRSCPNQIIKPTDSGYGLASLSTPHLEFGPYGCDYFCQVCQQVCPNRAIPLQSLRDKQKTPIGIARIDESLCVVYKEGLNCLVCEEVCPVPQKAIGIEVNGLRAESGEVLRQPKMIPERCIGCGICESMCPAEKLAIRVYGENIPV